MPLNYGAVPALIPERAFSNIGAFLNVLQAVLPFLWGKPCGFASWSRPVALRIESDIDLLDVKRKVGGICHVPLNGTFVVVAALEPPRGRVEEVQAWVVIHKSTCKHPCLICDALFSSSTCLRN